MPSRDSERSLELQALLRELRPRILELLATYRVPEDKAAEIVHDTFIALAVRWHRVGNRKAWLLGTLEARCRAWEQSVADPVAGDSTPEAPGEPEDGEGGP